MSTRDTDFADTGVGTVDPAYMELLGTGLEDVDEPEREVGFEPVPRCDYYHGVFEGATSGFSKNKSTPFVRPTFRILAGPEGTIGRLVSDDIYFTVSDTIREKNQRTGETIERPKTPAEREASILQTKQTLKRIATRLALPRPVPPSLLEDGLRAYAAGFAGREAILAIREEKARGEYGPRNRIIWRSIAAPTDPAKKPNGAATTALDEALAQIEKQNARGVKSASNTVTGLGKVKATDF